MNKNFYLTTTLPYVNAEPHIGFALEIVQADSLVRYHRLLGENVVFNFGTDEHGQKIYQKALAQNKDPQKYCDEYAEKFDALKKALNLSYTNFIRTTDPHHVKAAQELWAICLKNGFIEKGIYKAKYCVGCELEKQDSDLVDGRCPLHPDREIELIEEENYFFKFSKFQEKLLKLYKENPDFVTPKNRLTEISNFVSSGLQDFSVSRLKEKMPWGIPVPNDDKHIMYVWFDALTNYISTLGWPENTANFEKFWGTNKEPNAIQVAGKDNLRQQSAMWQAMLMAANLPPTKQIFIHGFITVGGQKISKSLGNVINPYELVEKYGTDAVRYYLLSKINPSDDSDFTIEKFEEFYNADLANGLGNLVARVAKLAEKNNLDVSKLRVKRSNQILEDIAPILIDFKFDQAVAIIWTAIKNLDVYINKRRPWDEDSKSANKILGEIIVESESLATLDDIVNALKIFLPETAEKIEKQFAGPTIKSQNPLFPRIK